MMVYVICLKITSANYKTQINSKFINKRWFDSSLSHHMKAIDIVKRQDKFYITLNFLGGMVTYADHEDDIDVAVTEAIIGIVKVFNNHGLGVTKEINDIFESKKILV